MKLMTVLTALTVLALPGLVLANGPSPVPAPAPAPTVGKLQCESKPLRGDRREVSCPLVASAATQRFRFKAHFSGSHDDTTASIVSTLDGTPLVCAEGSKTDLMGEEGDVSLECRFSIPAKAGTTHVLRVLLEWHHARYTDFEFRSE